MNANAGQGMDFGDVIKALRSRNATCCARKGWNGKGMWITLVHAWQFNFRAIEGYLDPETQYLPFIAMFTADQNLVPWLASQTDMLADDWEVVA